MNSVSLSQLAPRAPEAHYELGLLLRQKGDLEAAATEFRRAIELSPSDGPSLLNLAQILGLQGKTEESHQAMQRFVALRKDRDTLRTVQLYNDTGIRMVEQGDVNAGIGYFRASIELSPDSSDMHRNLAKALFQAGKLEEAGKEYETTIRLNPRDWQAHCGLGEVLAQQDRLPESIKEVETGTQLNPAQPRHTISCRACTSSLMTRRGLRLRRPEPSRLSRREPTQRLRQVRKKGRPEPLQPNRSHNAEARPFRQGVGGWWRAARLFCFQPVGRFSRNLLPQT